MWVDVVVLTAIGTAVLSGLVTLHRNQAFFSHFRICDLLHRRLDGWLYVGNSMTTAACMVDLYIRSRAIWTGLSPDETYCWALSLFSSIGISIFHVTTNMILKDAEFCDHCRESWKKDERWTSKEAG